MSETSAQLVVAVFEQEKAANEELKQLKRAKKSKQIDMRDAAVIRRDEKNKLHVKETGDIRPGTGAGIGAGLGVVIGLLAGPAGVVIGGAMGAMAGAAISAGDSGIPDYRLKEIGDTLQPGTSAVVAIVDQQWTEATRNQMTEAGGKVHVEALREEFLAHFDDLESEGGADDESSAGS